MNTPATLSEGLSSRQARAQLDQFGPSEIYQPYKISMLGIAREEVAEPMILLLLEVRKVLARNSRPSVAEPS